MSIIFSLLLFLFQPKKVDRIVFYPDVDKEQYTEYQVDYQIDQISKDSVQIVNFEPSDTTYFVITDFEPSKMSTKSTASLGFIGRFEDSRVGMVTFLYSKTGELLSMGLSDGQWLMIYIFKHEKRNLLGSGKQL